MRNPKLRTLVNRLIKNQRYRPLFTAFIFIKLVKRLILFNNG